LIGKRLVKGVMRASSDSLLAFTLSR